MSSVVSYEIVNNIGVIKVDSPPVNALSQAVREGILDAVNAAQKDDTDAIVLMCEGRTFIAGADITEFGKPPRDPSLPAVLGALENSSKLVVAAIHGTALGGGFETALACHYRCAVPSAKVGLPEVKLGILPGAGGTQRVPRIAGVKAALEMITSGNPVAAAKASDMGLIDEVLAGKDLKSEAVAYARDLADSGALLKRIRDIKIDPASIEPGFFDAYRKQVAKRARGQIAQDRIVSCVEAAVNLPMDEGLEVERKLFSELVSSPQSKAMRHAFFAEREAAKIKDLPKDTPIRDVKHVAIIGSGTMGGGIAMCFANVGIPVTLVELNQEALDRGLGIIRKNYSITVQKGKMSEADMEKRLKLIDGTTSYDDIKNVDLVIEAVFENPDIKKEVFGKLDAVCKQGAILATNTSYQDVNMIAEATSRPQDVVGMHFFSPANVMKLLEVVRGDKTADDVLATVMKLGKTIGKVCALSRVCYGFIGNRMLQGYGRQAHMLLLDGATPTQVDAAAEKFGMAMGPLAVGDLAGLDIGYKARQALGTKPDPRTCIIADALVEMDRLGQKSGAGYYKYDAATRARQADPEVEALIKEKAKELGIEQRDISEEEIVDRLFFPLINEGALILEEGIAQRPGDIDVVYLYGYGFPVAKGGPMFYGDQVGLKQVYDRICEFRDKLGADYWQPAPLLEKLAKEGKTFADWAKENG
ncbi:3-hydroxyacyl-CoA dehydrogenase NAD-binding domain-containing protein [Pseudohongiella sp. SYSU M77423]|uniref:3-hydroxyacyl-CoA dehydrogenase NAD-binding domain-containing protein n=1 Tax=Pseudohongiella sp. SYSU M77423 TaxID=3042312 RepID=UPI00247FB300|nr:3-hydroxyacyl-CoA dehydrogenase NAD-binding domain-containing protein [Pseudohongiella sp. SYSU M77423]MDH7942370.1 3-hydroxyacyl-CoA dehydrogenase NAD-binding domain-containing protein [Pseudohongiella sp. SYSU M77423]